MIESKRKMIIKISTHTLTWSVTEKLVVESIDIIISTHTLTWSVTYHEEYNTMFIRISTHTLTWSVTHHKSANKCLWYHFNSHAHVERDLI